MKLGTHIQKDKTDVFIKLHNSGFNNYSVMPLFGLRNSCKKFNLAHNSNTVQHFQMKLGTHVTEDKTHVYTNSI